MHALAKITALVTRRFHPRGTQRILRFLFDQEKLRLEDVIRYDHDLRVKVHTGSHIERELFFRGYYEERVIETMKQMIREGDVALDVGANIGSHTLIMAKLVGANGQVLAFEPHPDAYEKLMHNVTLNHFINTDVFKLALSDTIGIAHFFCGDHLPDTETASLHALPNLEKSMDVSVSTIDALFEGKGMHRWDFMKIDTRGHDLYVIKGGRKSIRTFRPSIIFEYNAETWHCANASWKEAQEFFLQSGYSLYLIGRRNMILLGEKMQPDTQTSYNVLALPK